MYFVHWFISTNALKKSGL